MVKLFRVSNIILRVSLLLAGVFSMTIGTDVKAATIPPALNLTLITGGLTQPVFVTNAGDTSNRLFIVQQSGQIRIFKNGSLISTPFLNISGLVSNFTGVNGEQGLLGLAFDPNYGSNGIFYITYTTRTNDSTFPYTTTLARYHVSSGDPNLANPNSGSVLLSIPKKFTNHNGGMITFGPDGYLYMSMGDGGSGGDPDNNAQNLHTMLGKLLRLDVNSTPPNGQKYVIPPTNPFYGSTDVNVKKEIWAYGLRNSWRFSFDRLTGDLYIGDVGQNKEEEVDFQPGSSAGGENYGWHILEGNLCYSPSTNCSAPAGYVPPVAVYDHGTNDSYGCSITGGYVYRGNQFPSLQGVYFYGDYCSGKLLGLIRNPNNTWSHNLIVSTNFSISSFGEDEQGELYVTDYGNGRIYQISSISYTLSGNAGAAGVTLSYTDGIARTVTSQLDGSYSLLVGNGWSGTVTPSHPCYTFNPANHPYTNITANQTGQDFVATFDPASGCANVNVKIGGTSLGQYGIPSAGKLTPSFPGTFNGPVHIASTNSRNIFVSERAIYGNSFTETLGIPGNQLTTDYWFPWYDGLTMRTWISIGAPDTNMQTAAVDIYIGGTKMNATSYQIAPGGLVTPTPIFPGTFNGPVEVKSTNGQNILVSERAIYGNSFTETLGVPRNQLTTDYWFPWYDGLTMRTWISIGAPDTNTQTAMVDIYIGGTKMNATSYQVAPGGLVSPTPNFPGTFNGPVEVRSTNGQEIFVSERAIYGSSFTETLGIPGDQLTTDYWFSWYDWLTMRTWISLGAPDTNTQDALVDIYIGGTKMNASSYHVAPGGQVSPTPNFPGTFNGPVEVVSTNGQNIFVSERAIYGGSFAETVGMADNRLTTDYWFPWYDWLTMRTWLSIGVP